MLFDIPDKNDKSKLNAYKAGIFDEKVDSKYSISEHEEKVLRCWDEFYKGINLKVIGFPIWTNEFKETYDLNKLPAWKAEFCKKNRKLKYFSIEKYSKWGFFR